MCGHVTHTIYLSSKEIWCWHSFWKGSLLNHLLFLPFKQLSHITMLHQPFHLEDNHLFHKHNNTYHQWCMSLHMFSFVYQYYLSTHWNFAWISTWISYYITMTKRIKLIMYFMRGAIDILIPSRQLPYTANEMAPTSTTLWWSCKPCYTSYTTYFIDPYS